MFGYEPSDTKYNEISVLRSHIRYRTLKDELQSTDQELQTLRPTRNFEIDKSPVLVKNGINPELSCTQVHYLKGYFLLQYLCDIVTKKNFFRFLRKYVHELYHGRLVHSTEFLTLFFDEFYGASDSANVFDLKHICDNWLDSSELPKELNSKYECNSLSTNTLLNDLNSATKWWLEFNKKFKSRKRKLLASRCTNSKSVIKVPESVKTLVAEQLVLLLENLLLTNCLSHQTLDILDIEYSFRNQSPDVQHRFAELIVKNSCIEKLCFVDHFLYQHQSMGIYLYGEMAMSKNKNVKNRARKIFLGIKNEMDPTMIINVKEMLMGNVI